MDNKEKVSFAINQISIVNCDGTANENCIKAVRLLQEVHNDLINYTHSSLLLKEKKTMNFDEFIALHFYIQHDKHISKNNGSVWSEKAVSQKYKNYLQNL